MRGPQEEKRPKINIIREVILYLALKGITITYITKGHNEFDFGFGAMTKVVVQISDLVRCVL